MKIINHRSDEMGSTVFSIIAGVVNVEDNVRREYLGKFIDQYGAPLRLHIMSRSGFDSSTAEDLLHDFLVDKLIAGSSKRNLAQQYLDRDDSSGISFRGYLLRSLNNYIIDHVRKKRLTTRSLNHEFDAPVFVQTSDHIDRFDMNWAENLLQQAVQSVRQECLESNQGKIWEIFELRILEPARTGQKPPEYDELIERIGFTTAKEASNRLRTSIRKFNRALRELIRQYLPHSNSATLEFAITEELEDLRKVLRAARELTIEKIDAMSEETGSTLVNSVDLLSLESSSELIWNNENGINKLWLDVLSSPLDVLIEEWNLSNYLKSPVNLGEKTVSLIDLWQHASPSVDFLQAIKKSAKVSAMNIKGQEKMNNGLPYGINVILYTTVIALADLRLRVKISSDTDARIMRRLKTVLKTPWIDAITREILADWLGKVTGRLQAESQRLEHAF